MVAFYHVRVATRHREKTATSCRGYLTQVLNELTGALLHTVPGEAKWQGRTALDVLAMPRSSRDLDVSDRTPSCSRLLVCENAFDLADCFPRQVV